MKYFVLIFFIIITKSAFSQDISFNELLHLKSMKSQGFDSYLLKKGFERNRWNSHFSNKTEWDSGYIKRGPNLTLHEEQSLNIKSNNVKKAVTYKTYDSQHYDIIKKAAIKNGFVFSETTISHKGNMMVEILKKRKLDLRLSIDNQANLGQCYITLTDE